MLPVNRTSHRERSKERRRLAIQKAAFRLFAEHGYEATTVAAIADAADVAPRTVSLYFPTKADLVLSWSSAAAERAVASLNERRPDETVLEAISRWLQEDAENIDPEMVGLLKGMYDANPMLRAMTSAQISQAFNIGTQAFAAELGLPPDHIAVRIQRGAVTGVINEYLAAVSAGSTPAEEALDTAMRFLRAGTRAITPN